MTEPTLSADSTSTSSSTSPDSQTTPTRSATPPPEETATTSETAPEDTGSDVPVAPPMTLDEPVSEEVTLKRKQDLATAFDAFVDAGRERARKMAAAAARRTTAIDEVELFEKASRLQRFNSEYTSLRGAHSDGQVSDCTFAYTTRWNTSTDTNKLYHNTPEPGRNRILCWTITRDRRETLRSSDIFFFQYLREAGGSIATLPPLRVLRQQNTASDSSRAVYDYLRQDEDSERVPSGVHQAGTDTYYALLATENGSGPTYLVVDFARELGITGIAAIEIDYHCNLYFYFSSPTTDSSSTTSTTSTPSSSSSTSSSSTSSTSSTSS